MTHVLLYIAVVIIWGTTWIMVKFQLGVVAVEVSVAYRFAIAAVLMFAWVMVRRLPLKFSPRDHLFMALQGALIFSSNFYFMYLAAAYVTTGLIAVVFSSASVMTLVFNAVVFRRRPGLSVLGGCLLGVFGIALIFWPELRDVSGASGAATGLMFSLAGTACFAMGGIVTARNHGAGLSVRGSTAWAMLYGFALLSLFAVLSGAPLAFDPSFAYVGSLLYLGIFGSVIAFACYFALLGKIGPDRAAYATVLFPIIALSISTLFESYQWTALAALGVVLTLAGNVLVLRQPKETANGTAVQAPKTPV